MKLPAWLIGRLPDGEPYEPKGDWALYFSHIGAYMKRLILKTPWGTLRAHRILREDRDDNPHDHPFDFTSLVVRGGYDEELHEGGRAIPMFHRFGSIIRRRAVQTHRITRVLPGTLTLVVSGPKVKSWGFLTPDGWVYWRDYFSRAGDR